MNYHAIAISQKSDQDFIASIVELDLHAHGRTPEDAMHNLRKVVQFYIDTATTINVTIIDLLQQNYSAQELVDSYRLAAIN